MRIFFLILILFCSHSLFALDETLTESKEEVSAEEKEADDKEQSEKDKEKAEKEKIESLNQEKRDALLYGIDTEVIDVISTIRSEKDMTFNKELNALIQQNENAEINRAVLEFFSQMKVDLAEDRAMDLLSKHLDDYEYSTNLLLSAISYLSSIESKDAGSVFYDLLEDQDKAIASASLRGIGKLKDDSRVEEISNLLEEYSGDSEYEDFSASAILVLGELKYLDSQIFLEDILQDEDAPATHRQYAAVSLGEFQQPEGLVLLQSMYSNSEDSLLRSYILKGITYYDNDEVDHILMTALRDSFWRIRVAACEGLGERKVKDAVDILQYKVKKDPVRQVRFSAMKALGDMETSKADDFIISQFEGARIAFDIRMKALDLMVENKISGSVKALENVLGPKWEKDNDNELGPICKVLSTAEWAQLKPFYREMLAHKDFVIRIYGIRGIKINKIITLKDDIKALDTEDQQINVRREIKAALESM